MIQVVFWGQKLNWIVMVRNDQIFFYWLNVPLWFRNNLYDNVKNGNMVIVCESEFVLDNNMWWIMDILNCMQMTLWLLFDKLVCFRPGIKENSCWMTHLFHLKWKTHSLWWIIFLPYILNFWEQKRSKVHGYYWSTAKSQVWKTHTTKELWLQLTEYVIFNYHC